MYNQLVNDTNSIFLKISRFDGIVTFGYNQTNGVWTNVTNGALANQSATLKCTFANNNSNIYNFRVNKSVTTNKEVTNQALVTLNKTSSGFQTKIDIAQRTATETIRQFSVVSAYIPATVYSNGIDLNFNADLKNKTLNYLINGQTQGSSSANWVENTTGVLPLIPIINKNQVGGALNASNALSFDMCYLNYTMSPYEAAVQSQSFSFDDATSKTITNNAPVSATGTIMTVSPTIVRTLSGLCQVDSDGDGIYDLNEDINQDDNLANDDSDGDGIPNYLDVDDDGDGVLTKNEGVSITNNQFSPFEIIDTSLDTDIDGVPNYLDIDDDGDGVATKYEGAFSDGTGQDTDHDDIYDYLDKDDDGDGVYTMYEGANPDGDLNPNTGNTLNTDHFTDRNGNRVVNLVPDYLDNDDDGDGVLTMYEGANPDGNPNTGNTLNTDAVTGDNPNVKVDTIPNYLDSDDDGDGYATWEEGANPDGDGNPNTGATLDTDNDGIPDYLDYSDIVHPATQEIVLNNYVNLVGDKRYELANHLGNVLAVVSDKKIPMFNTEGLPSSGLKYFNADVLSYSDYYPFGMLIPNRHGSSDSYRYGFSGKEKDDEIKGEGNSYDFGERLLDPRVGRWWSTDNVEKPWLTPYQFAANNPINNIDPDGNDEIHFYYKTQQMLDKDGNGYTQLTLSSEIIKNNSEHTFFMHSPQGATTEFHPFKSDRTPNTGSRSAYDAKLPLSKGTSFFFGLGEKGVDDHSFLGKLLQVAPEIMVHYKDVKKDGMRFQGAVDMAGSVDFAEKVIAAEEITYAILDGYFLVKGLGKFAVKELAKNSVKIGSKSLDNIVSAKKMPYLTSRPPYASGQVESVWNAAKNAEGRVFDPNTGEELFWDPTKPRAWDMGHIYGKEYKDLFKEYVEGNITKDQFLKKYRDPKNYVPESKAGNRSHKFEKKK